MSRSPAKVTQADVARALRAVAQTGLSAVVEIATDGTIRIVPTNFAQITEPEPLDDDEPIDL
ncbi:MAG: hypothetical protein ACOH2N_15015 [Devosia sp.]